MKKYEKQNQQGRVTLNERNHYTTSKTGSAATIQVGP
jgi:hypothetical protein